MNAPVAAPILSIRAMGKRMESGGSVFELEIPELDLLPGRFYGLVGRSGSGKSTMLDLLAMVSRPSHVDFFGLEVAGRRIDLADIIGRADDAAISAVRLAHFGYILQSGGLFPFLTVRENLRLPFLLAERKVDEGQLEKLAGLYDMGAQLDKKPGGLSGGQRQRVSILRALCLAPEIILADEPTASVDENMAEIIVAELRRLAKARGATVVMVSHDIDLVSRVADEIITLKPEPVAAGVTRTVVRLRAEVSR